MKKQVEKQIRALIDLETKGWDTKNPDLFLSIIHPDMVWPWPPTAEAHDPVEWVFVFGHFNREKWRRNWQELFDTHNLIHNRRKTVKIEITADRAGALAVVDIDTLWQHRETGKNFHWKGRVCKIYTLMPNGEWKFYFQTGVLDYSRLTVKS